ncbi:hypothetical protein GmHk_13G038192 [Glycine max]|nr:hypothetical protein GmHk_13G038192 [Glycine max]
MHMHVGVKKVQELADDDAGSYNFKRILPFNTEINTLILKQDVLDLLIWCSKQPSFEHSPTYESFFRMSQKR